MSSKNWSTCSHDSEEETPVPPLTKCTAIKSFLGKISRRATYILAMLQVHVTINMISPPTGEQATDLPFERGEILTIIEPCNVIYWYLAENSMGRRGVIPITYVQVGGLKSCGVMEQHYSDIATSTLGVSVMGVSQSKTSLSCDS
jgi:hypothetical protein